MIHYIAPTQSTLYMGKMSYDAKFPACRKHDKTSLFAMQCNNRGAAYRDTFCAQLSKRLKIKDDTTHKIIQEILFNIILEPCYYRLPEQQR
jgi:hypothetical protein